MICARLKRALRSERGAATVELVIFAPFLMVFIGTFITIWDAFRTANLSLYASYTVADHLSRKEDVIGQPDIDELGDLLAFLVPTSGQTAVRVTVLQRTVDELDQPYTEWVESWSTNGTVAPPTTETADVAEYIPVLAVGKRIYITEAFTDWEPFYGPDILPGRMMHHVAATPPRFVAPPTQSEKDAMEAEIENPDVDDGV